MIVECPHCQDTIIIESINCGIFRHGVLKADGKQIDPHLPQHDCEKYFKNNLIFGCGKPFQIIENKVQVCGYI